MSSIHRVFTSEQKHKLTQIVNEGVGTLQEIEDLNAGLSETIKAVAEELQIKPAVLKKAIKTIMKSNFQQHSEDLSELENILSTVGRLD